MTESETRLAVLRAGRRDERSRCVAAAEAVRDYYQGEADAAISEGRYGEALANQIRADAASAVAAAITREGGES